MRASQFIIPTQKEIPADAVVKSHQLMLRAGLMRKEAAGLYYLLPLGVRVIQKIQTIVREEMNRAGAVEFLLPILIPADLWRTSGRWTVMGPEMFRLKDRHDGDLVLGPTHEEAMTSVVQSVLKSYRDLPKNVYQMHTKFRDEIRPRFGMIRSREFIMKDAYSFHADEADLDREYQNMRAAYTRIFERCGLNVVHVQADSGAMGGSGSEEFMVPSDIGEEVILTCEHCDYAGNTEKVPAVYSETERYSYAGKEEGEVHTPNIKTIEDLEKFFQVPQAEFLKTLIYDSPHGLIMIVLRGDRELNEVKLKNLTGEVEIYPAAEGKIQELFGCPPGFLGPAGLDDKQMEALRIYFDESVRTVEVGVTGANKTDYHLAGVKPDELDVNKTWADLSAAVEDDICPNCMKPGLNAGPGIEVGHIFKLGDKYTKAFDFNLLDPDGNPQTPIMGTYGIGVNRTMQTVIEQNWDEGGIIFPKAVAPFQIVIVPISKNEDELAQVDELYNALVDAGHDVLIDDRDERPGFKFKDADLIGYPLRITVGKGFFGGGGEVEIKVRAEEAADKLKVGKLTELVEKIPGLLERCP